MQCHPRRHSRPKGGNPLFLIEKVFPKTKGILKRRFPLGGGNDSFFSGMTKICDDYVTFSFVMLFAHIPIVETLCKKADVVGERIPRKPPTSKLVLNVTMKR